MNPDSSLAESTPHIITADALDWMRDYAGDPFDAIVTDPPYGLAFMAKSWDSFKSPLAYQEWTRDWAGAALQVVKPGAHMVAFGAPRLYHRMAVGIEDAGWEIRDSLMWLFGQGFPKSLNLAGDQTTAGVPSGAGVCECDVFVRKGSVAGATHPSEGANNNCRACGKSAPPQTTNGYGTALKPGYEPIVLARAPFAGTVQGNYDAHGTGALHIDAARIPLNAPADWAEGDTRTPADGNSFEGSADSSWIGIKRPPHDAGRWPANVVLDEDAAALLDAEFEAPPWLSIMKPYVVDSDRIDYSKGIDDMTSDRADQINRRAEIEGAATGPSRFFYTAKASRSEREAGLRSAEVRRDDGRDTDSDHPRLRTTSRRNHHPSVKPIDLMRWLCRLAVPAGGRVLDPFSGSGTTLIAAHAEGMDAVGVERDLEYVGIARARIAHHCAQLMMDLDGRS